MEKPILVAVFLIVFLPILGGVIFLGYAWWSYEHRPAAYLLASHEKVAPGMKLEEVVALFGRSGQKIGASALPMLGATSLLQTMDEDPKRFRDAAPDEEFYYWQTDEATFSIVSLKRGVVAEKYCRF